MSCSSLVGYSVKYRWCTLPDTNGLPLKMDGWNTILSVWDGLFSGAFALSFREDNSYRKGTLFVVELHCSHHTFYFFFHKPWCVNILLYLHAAQSVDSIWQ